MYLTLLYSLLINLFNLFCSLKCHEVIFHSDYSLIELSSFTDDLFLKGKFLASSVLSSRPLEVSFRKGVTLIKVRKNLNNQATLKNVSIIFCAKMKKLNIFPSF